MNGQAERIGDGQEPERVQSMEERRKCLMLLALTPLLGGVQLVTAPSAVAQFLFAPPVRPTTPAPSSLPFSSSSSPTSSSTLSRSTSTAWANDMFVETTHAFGTVTRNTPAEYRFKFQNLYEEDVSVRSVRTSCSCTNASETRKLLKTHETAEIVATVDTVRHHGYRNVTITVTFDRPFLAEVQLDISVLIRDDIQFMPAEVKFDPVRPGTEVKRSVRIRKTGVVDPSWRVVEMKSSSEHIYAELYDRRVKGARMPDYEVVVTQRGSMPPSRFNERIMFTTSDPAVDAQQFSISVQGRVIQPLSLTPGTLFFGQVHPGETLTRNLSLCGEKPFKITGAGVDNVGDSDFQFSSRPSTATSHLIAVELTAGRTPGIQEGEIRVRTDMSDQGLVTCCCRFEVLAPGARHESETFEVLPE